MSEEDRTHILNKIRDKESDKGLSFKFLRFNEWTLDYTHFLDRRLVYDHNFGREDYLITREFMYRYVRQTIKPRKIETDQICFPKPLRYQQTEEQIFEER